MADHSEDIEFDLEKDRKNREKHKLPLTLAGRLFTSGLYIEKDLRKDYGEDRFIAQGEVEGRLLVCVYTWRGERRRIISLRKANAREVEAYRRRLAGGIGEGAD